MESDNPFIEFINQLPEVDELKKKVRKIVPAMDDMIQAETIDTMIKEWIRICYPKTKPDPQKIEYCVKVVNEISNTIIYADSFPYIEALVEWLRMSSDEPIVAGLVLFLLGYCWREALEEGG